MSTPKTNSPLGGVHAWESSACCRSNRKRVETGQTGELVARRREYHAQLLEQSGQTRVHSGTFFRTGDVGYQDERNFYILDRLKDMIVTGGEKFTPAKSKRDLTHPAGARVAVFEYPIRNGAKS